MKIMSCNVFDFGVIYLSALNDTSIAFVLIYKVETGTIFDICMVVHT